MDMLKLFSHKRLLIEVIYTFRSKIDSRIYKQRLCKQPMRINGEPPPVPLYGTVFDRPAFSQLYKLHPRRRRPAHRGPAHRGTPPKRWMFEPESLESLWVDDEDGCWTSSTSIVELAAHRVVL